MRAVSLFSGAGGFEFGLDRAGINTVLQAECDPHCLKILERHYPHVQRVDDVRKVTSRSLSGGRGDPGRDGGRADAQRLRHERGADHGVDLVYGGFPCQDVSVAGNRAGLSGARSGLWSEFARVLRELRPRWLVVENVPGLLSSNGGRDFLRILMDLDDLGYGVAWRILDARWFGVPQRRRRVFLVGCLGDAAGAQAVLAVCESCGGHPAPRRQTGQGAAATLRGRTSRPGVNIAGRGGEDDDNLVVAHTLPAEHRGIGNGWNHNYIAGSQVDDGQAQPLTARESDYRMDLESENFLLVANPVAASAGHHGHSSPRGDGSDNLLAFHMTQDPISSAESPALSGNAYVGVTAFDWMTQGSDRTRPHASGDYASALEAGKRDALSIPSGVRRLTPLECERLMGWPDEWTKGLPDSHRYRMCGNGVVAPVAEWIGHRLMAVARLASGLQVDVA